MAIFNSLIFNPSIFNSAAVSPVIDNADVNIGRPTKQILYADTSISVNSRLSEPSYLKVISKIVDNTSMFMKSRISDIMPLSVKSRLGITESVDVKSIISDYTEAFVNSKVIDSDILAKAEKSNNMNKILKNLIALDLVD